MKTRGVTECENGDHVIDCAWARPIYISRADVPIDYTALQIDVYDRTGSKMCGWK